MIPGGLIVATLAVVELLSKDLSASAAPVAAGSSLALGAAVAISTGIALGAEVSVAAAGANECVNG